MTSHTVVATCNVLCTLGHEDAGSVLGAVLEQGPDLVGLQEWRVSRHRLLRETGSVRVLPPQGSLAGSPRDPGSTGYVWVSPLLGGCPVGARADRFELLGCRSRVLGRAGRSDRGAGPVPVVLPRTATVAVFRDRRAGRVVGLVNYHLTPGVQSRGRYRTDRPLLSARHRAEVVRLGRVVEELLALGHAVYAVGDSNFDGLRLDGLTSAWAGREHGPGTLGSRRKIDDVHGPGVPVSLRLVATASDHQAVVARRADV